MIHVINANRYSVSPAVIDAGTKGSYGNDYLRLALSSDWDGLAVKISFYPIRNPPVVVVCGDDDVLIPSEIYSFAGCHMAVISGENTGRVMISMWCRQTLQLIHLQVLLHLPKCRRFMST